MSRGQSYGRRAQRALIVLSVFVLLVVPVAAIAGTSLFDDVPDDSIFVNDINWMKENGITRIEHLAHVHLLMLLPVWREPSSSDLWLRGYVEPELEEIEDAQPSRTTSRCELRLYRFLSLYLGLWAGW